jgi:alpha-tubulin suppressor-like RCC1 family protein
MVRRQRRTAWPRYRKSYKLPRRVATLPGAVQSSCSKGEKNGHTSVVDVEGRLFSFGSGYKGQLGLDDTWDHRDPADRIVPEAIQDFRVDSVHCGGIHTLALAQGVLFSWGCGSDGRIGHPESEGHRYLYREARPRTVEGFGRVGSVSASYYHSIFSLSES